MIEESSALRRARQRRSEGTMADFDGMRLSLARRRARLQRTALARQVGVSASAITQFEKGAAKPTHPVAAGMALALGVPIDFLHRGTLVDAVPPGSAHFRSLRSTPALSRDQALAFAELALTVTSAFEDYVDFPEQDVPTLEIDVDSNRPAERIKEIAYEVRQCFGLGLGPIPHVVKVLEGRGVIVLRLPKNTVDPKVDAFSTDAGHRRLILLSPEKNDKARSRFDAAHELGHLVMHAGVEPGSKIIENQAQSFAAHFLMPEETVIGDLPRRVDWDVLLEAKRKWGVSLRALVYRAHELGLWSDSVYQRANKRLSIEGNPERGPLGPPESPTLLGKAADLLEGAEFSMGELAKLTRLPYESIKEVVEAGSDPLPKLKVVP